MIFEKFKPAKAYEHLIAYYWTIRSSENDEENLSYRFVPDAYVDWVFHLKSPWQCDFPNRDVQLKTGRFHVFGQIKAYINLFLPEDQLEAFGVKFHPWAASHIWKLDMHYLTNSCLSLVDLDIPNIGELQERISLSTSTEERIKHIESFLLPYLNYNGSESLKPVLKQLSTNPVNFNKLECAIGKRRLQQRFKNEIGISPKLFFRTMRINSIVEHLKIKSAESLTQLALEYNYFDQTHFIKDFKHFTGMSPTKFLESINPNGDILNLSVSE